MRPRRGSRHRPPLSARARALAGARVTRCSPRAALSPCGRARAPRLARWIGFVVVLWIYLIRVYYINGWYIVTYGLGDCSLFVCDCDGETAIHSAMPDNAAHEREAARRVIEEAGGLDKLPRLIDDPALLARERALRGQFNSSASNVWTRCT